MRSSGGMEAKVRLELGRRLSPRRIEHAERVATLARELCRRFALPEQAGALAGLAHDIAREVPLAELATIASRDGAGVDDDERRMPVILHGRAGAVILREELGIDEGAVLEAVRDHVTGRPGMGALSAVVYAADYLEPGRGFLPEAERRAILSGGLGVMVRAVAARTVAHLEERGRLVAGVSRELAAWLEREEEAYGVQAARG